MASRFEKVCAAICGLIILLLLVIGAGFTLGSLIGIGIKDSATGLEIVGARLYVGLFFVGVMYGLFAVWDFTAFVYRTWGQKS